MVYLELDWRLYVGVGVVYLGFVYVGSGGDDLFLVWERLVDDLRLVWFDVYYWCYVFLFCYFWFYCCL